MVDGSRYKNRKGLFVISDGLAGLYVTDPVFILIHEVFVQDQEPLEF